MKMMSLCLLTLAAAGAGAGAAPTNQRSATLTQDPLVIRVGDDEFQIAFGIKSDQCAATGCVGSIRYTVDWKSADGMTRSAVKHVTYAVSPLAPRTIAVDYPVFDGGAGVHTDIVKVRVEKITCRENGSRRAS